MSYSAPRLHPPVLRLDEQRKHVAFEMTTVADARMRDALSGAILPATASSIIIPLTTVSLQSNFDAKIHVSYPGSRDPAAELTVDSGNTSLIVPSYAAIAKLESFAQTYQVLATGLSEPWGCPANILRGPIQIPAQGGVYQISDCVFYACTGPNAAGNLTANFGMGLVSPWPMVGDLPVQSPLSYDPNYPFAEVDYAPADQLFAATSQPHVNQSSALTLFKATPPGYQSFDIMRGVPWMSLAPRALSIGDVATGWPGARPSIAMIDTGGGPVFLSDPDGFVYGGTWPDPATNPWWTQPPSVACQSTYDRITFAVGDDNGSYAYTIDTSALPQAVRGLTLVMCEQCAYMMGQNGMNVGGITALFNYILIDYAAGKLGLRSKAAPVG